MPCSYDKVDASKPQTFKIIHTLIDKKTFASINLLQPIGHQ